MANKLKPVVSIQQLALELFEQGEHYASLDAGLSPLLGLTQIGAGYSEVPPGKSACPFHVHHVADEMFVILEGSGVYRFGDATYRIKAGDVLGAPRGGAELAHKITNTGNCPLKYLAISSQPDTDVCEYPDSGKFLVSSHRLPERNNRLRFIGRLEDSIDYWDGENSAE
jgi:uncharacterized cupin superfamily protein